MPDPQSGRGGLEAIAAELASAPDLTAVGVTSDGVIRSWPSAARSLLGWSAEEIVGRRVEALFRDEERAELAKRLAGAPGLGEWHVELAGREGEPVPCGVRVFRSPPTPGPAAPSGDPAPGPPGTAASGAGDLVVLLRDRRGDAAAEQRLRWSRSLLSVLGTSTFVLDAGGRIREIGADWLTESGGDAGSWLGRHIGDLLETDRREILAALRQAARGGEWSGTAVAGGRPVSLALRAVRDEHGNLEALVGARRPPEGGAARDLLRKVPVGLILLDAELRVRETNPELAAICGDDALPPHPVGLDVRSLGIFQTRAVQEALEGLLEGRPFDLPETRLTGTSLRSPVLRLRGEELLDDQGRRAGHLVMALSQGGSDVERQLLRAQKMESIGNFASGLAHDFGNFVSVILGKAGILRVKLPDDPHITGDLDDIETAAKRAQHLAQELMKFARGGRNRVERLDVNRLISEVGSLIRTSVGKRIDVDFRLVDGLPPVAGDEVEMQQLVLNLCLNARDAMPNGGRLTIETRPITEEQRARLATAANVTAGVALVVRDTGVGMPPEVVERIFEPFFTTKQDATKGAGLGLAMVYGIVRRHGGAIDVKSRVGLGTSFEIVLPAAGVIEEEDPNRRMALVVDDEPAFREMIRLILEEDGYRVTLAASGAEALRIIQEQHESLFLVILDLRMPGVDGLAVLDELRSVAPELPVLVTTGYAGAEEQARALERGARKVLEKPYRVVELRMALDEILAGKARATPPGSEGRVESASAAGPSDDSPHAG
ncbi:MAG: response regulator [bacterium]